MGARGSTLRLQVVAEFYVEECCECGVPFGMTTATHSFYRNHSAAAPGATKNFYCPNGHAQHYAGKTEEQKLREQLASERERNENSERFLREQRDREQNRSRALKGHLTRQRKRAKAGVCPCCNRTFKQLAAHMKSQHPDFEPEASE